MTTTTPTTVATLQMVRAEIDMREFQRWMRTRSLQDPDHAMHCLLKECFGDLAPKPFRLITPRGCSSGTFYGYGQADAASLREASSMYAEPLQSRITAAATLDSKPMPAQWRAGLRLGFRDPHPAYRGPAARHVKGPFTIDAQVRRWESSGWQRV